MNRTIPRIALWGLVLLGAIPWARADDSASAAPTLRDPTVPPLAARAPVASASGAAATPDTATAPRHLMVLHGKPYVIERGWPRGVGDKLGEARIARIEGQSVWLRDGTGLRKISLYPGVEIRPLAAAPAVDPVSPSASPKRAHRTDAAATLATKDHRHD